MVSFFRISMIWLRISLMSLVMVFSDTWSCFAISFLVAFLKMSFFTFFNLSILSSTVAIFL